MQPYDPLIEVIEKINETFDTNLPINKSPQDSNVKIGFEVEVSTSCYCPEAFTNGAINDHADKVFAEKELILMPILEKLHNCGVERTGSTPMLEKFDQLGTYYEFMIPASQSVQNITTVIDFLTKNNFIPEGIAPGIHFTAGNIHRDEDAYIALMFLEILFATPERLRSKAWKRSHQAGIKKRSRHELKNGDTIACEFRPLLLPVTLPERCTLIKSTFMVMRALHKRNSFFVTLKSEMQELLKSHALPNHRWRNDDDAVWSAFADLLPSMRRQFLSNNKHILSL